MFRTTLRSLWSHKRRLISTALAVLLGVAFMTGTLVLSGTLDKAFDDLFADVNAGVDTDVRGADLFDSQIGAGTLRAKIDRDTVEVVRGVEGVAAAEPYVLSFTGAALTRDGDALGGQGPPTIFESWIEDEQLNSFTVDEGRPPQGPGEVAMNRTAVEDGGYRIGDEVTLLSQQGREGFELVGVTMFGEAGSSAGVVSVELTLEEAQRIAGVDPEEIDNVFARGIDGVSDRELTKRIAAEVPDDVRAVTGEESAAELAESVQEGFGFLSQILLVFAGIALFVGTFIISNTFSILVAQRTKELALLRAIGASRRQVLGSVLLEASLTGVLAAVVGLAAGVALAYGAIALLAAFNVELPGDSLVVSPQTVLVALVVGLVVTVGAAVIPAVRATRVPPLAALRDVALDRSSRSWVRGGLGGLLLVAGLVAALPAFGADISRDDLERIALGVVAIIVSVLVAGPVLARPLSTGLGSWLPRVRGVTGRLAAENTKRNPARTASTAAALAIGITLVGFITIFGASTRAAVTTDVERGFRGDFIIQQPNNFGLGGVSPALADELAEVDGVEVAAGVKQGEAEATLATGDTTRAFLGAVDPTTWPRVFEVRMDQGELADLEDGGIVLDRSVADDQGLGVGDELALTLPGGGRDTFGVAAISDDPTLLGEWTITSADYTRLASEAVDSLVAIRLADGVDLEQIRPELRAVVDQYPTVALQDRDQFIGSLTNMINQFLLFIYALLALSVVIALIGIANTLSLSIHERTRELGLLRAVGMSRSQLRSAVRWEAVIVALVGTTLGLALAFSASRLVVQGLSPYGLGTYVIPWGQMAIVVLFGAGLGVLAALRPAARAAKLNVLDAIATE
ncbi:ABC transporter permease [soil metagenome]